MDGWRDWGGAVGGDGMGWYCVDRWVSGKLERWRCFGVCLIRILCCVVLFLREHWFGIWIDGSSMFARASLVGVSATNE